MANYLAIWISETEMLFLYTSIVVWEPCDYIVL